jgi:FAD/FMN-containing dehydrogenase
VLTTPLIGGLVATGSHGSGRDHATVSELVVAMEIIDSSGRVWRFSEEGTPGDVMNAVRLNLGLFGLIYSITLRVVPMFNVDVCDVTTADPDETLASITSALARAARPVPMLPSAPPTFSIMTGLPSGALMCLATIRANKSPALPAATDTIRVIGRDG